MAVDLAIANYDGMWASGNNYFLYQHDAIPGEIEMDTGYWHIFQIDLSTVMGMPVRGGQYNDSYSLQWPFPKGSSEQRLSMCCMPWKETTWVNQGRPGKSPLDRLLKVPQYEAIFRKALQGHVQNSGAKTAALLQRWFDIIAPARKLELETNFPGGVSRFFPTLKSLEKCTADNLQPQLAWTLQWIKERSEYITEILDQTSV